MFGLSGTMEKEVVASKGGRRMQCNREWWNLPAWLRGSVADLVLGAVVLALPSLAARAVRVAAVLEFSQVG